MLDQNTKDWARDLLLEADFGHQARVVRCERMLRRMAERPAGRVTEVFEEDCDLEGAYRFVEGSVSPHRMLDAFSAATLRGEHIREFMYVVVDGTSLSLTDRLKNKGFGSIGSRCLPTRGLKVIDALGVDADGTTRGLLDVQVWARGPKELASKRARRYQGRTETQRWVEVIDRAGDRAYAAGVKPWFVIDREGDAAVILRAVARTGGFFTVRVCQRERHCFDEKRRGKSVIQALGRRAVCGTYVVNVPKGKDRKARAAILDVRFARIALKLHEHRARPAELETFVVWARERRGPRGEQPLDWMLFTNRPVSSMQDAEEILSSYCRRWRIEDFHKTWKRGRCRVEDTQLRQRDHVVRWAIMLAVVATRVERLKHLARTQPDSPATVALTEIEIIALREAKRRIKKRTETITDEIPTIRTAVRWIAQLGGFHGKPNVQPGSVTLGRGLERFLVLAKGFEIGLKAARKRG
jgi:hypothetical protein